jgi:hypothetical protein
MPTNGAAGKREQAFGSLIPMITPQIRQQDHHLLLSLTTRPPFPESSSDSTESFMALPPPTMPQLIQ